MLFLLFSMCAMAGIVTDGEDYGFAGLCSVCNSLLSLIINTKKEVVQSDDLFLVRVFS